MLARVAERYRNHGWRTELIICFEIIVRQFALEHFGVNNYSKTQYNIFALAFLVIRCFSQNYSVQVAKEVECLIKG